MKAYAPDRLVDRAHVHEMLGVINAEANVSKGIIATTSGFAPRLMEAPGIEQLIPYRLELRDGADLQRGCRAFRLIVAAGRHRRIDSHDIERTDVACWPSAPAL